MTFQKLRLPGVILMLTASCLLNGCRRQQQLAEPPPAPSPTWPLTHAPVAAEPFTYLGDHTPILQLLAQADEETTAEAIRRLTQRVSETPALSPAETITPEGAAPGPLREAVRKLNHAAFDHALLWSLTGRTEHADTARQILLRFAEVLPSWPFYGPDGQAYAQDDQRYLRQWDARGLWGRWFPLDLADSIPLLRAYDLLRSTFDEAQQKQIETDLFQHQKQVIDRFTGTGFYHNMDGYHLMALTRFGQILRKPDWVHDVVEHWLNQIEKGYTSDGIYREMTVDYHQQISSRLTEALPALLKGYSDPPGYRHPATDRRFDELDLETLAPRTLRLIRASLAPLSLPDGSYINFNDSWPKRTGHKPPLPPNEPALLGGAGVAKLAMGNLAAFLKFDGTRGHDHKDALNLVWYANQKEVFSETGYRPRKEIRFERAWSASTASHLTATVDEALHFDHRAPLQVGAPINTFTSKPPQETGASPVEAAYPGASRYQNQGRVLLWNTAHSHVQAMEAEQPGSLPGVATLFRRTVLLVPFNENEGYLVDLFRLQGGSKHDYFLRGGLDHAYTLRTNLPLQPVQGTLYQHIDLRHQAVVRSPFLVEARYEDGSTVRSHFGGSPGNTPASLHYLLGTAPAIRRAGEAPFSLLRRTALPSSGPLESCFVWVHESTAGQPRIRRVSVHGSAMDAVIVVDLDGRRDIIFSSLKDESTLSHAGWTLHGRLAYATETGSSSTGTLLSGQSLRKGGWKQDGAPPLAGTVTATTKGDTDHSPTASFRPGQPPGSPSAAYRVAHFDLSEQTRISIPIVNMEAKEGEIVLHLAYAPGFDIVEGRSVFYHYPGWNLEGPCRITLE